MKGYGTVREHERGIGYITEVNDSKKVCPSPMLELGLYTGTRYQHRTEYRLAKYPGILVSIFNGMLIGILQNTNPCQTINTTK